MKFSMGQSVKVLCKFVLDSGYYGDTIRTEHFIAGKIIGVELVRGEFYYYKVLVDDENRDTFLTQVIESRILSCAGC